MKCEWSETTIGNLGTIITGKTPTTKRDEYWNGEVPFVTPKDLQGTKHIFNTERFITDKGMESVRGSILLPDSVCVSCIGNIGYVSMVTKKCISNQQINSIVTNENYNSDFVYYLMRNLWPFFKNYEGQSTTLSILNKTQFSKIEIYVPKLETQKKIAGVLSTLDDKIELNNKINDNLQQQIAEIYKSWYQDFSKANNLPLIETDYGVIPQGWHYVLLGDICKSVSITHKFDKDKLIFLNTGDIENGRFLHSNYMAVKNMPGQAKKTIAPGDILYSEIRPINKHFAYVDFASEDYVVSTKLMVIRTNGFDTHRLYQYLTSKDVLSELQMQAESRSGTFPQIRFENVSKLPILIADAETEGAFVALLHAVYAQVEHNNLENKKLVELRDTLLPKLMSGEINVSDVQL